MRYERDRLRGAVAALFIVSMIIAGGSPVAAQETGQWHARGVLVVVNKISMKVEDRTDHTVAATEFDGAVFNEEGKPFLDKARYQVVAVNDAGVLRVGYNTFTDAEGAKVFAKYSVTESKPPEHHGTFEFTGGTGKYEGLTGTGTFRITYISDRVGWNEFNAEYTIPPPKSAPMKTPQPRPATGAAHPKPPAAAEPPKPPAAAGEDAKPPVPATEEPKPPTTGTGQPDK